ncbi:MAG: glycoside hydrolase family 43 protein [Oscillospiraceae bacterium]|nr:glycoside hydrolase family 43 protein [Oscillospiraceae bacterium]
MRKIFLAATAALLFPAMLFTGCGSASVNNERDAASSSKITDSSTGTETDIITEKEIDRSAYDFSTGFDGALSKTLSSGAAVHDPSILKCGDKYYIFGSHMAAAASDDLISWKPIANGYSKGNPVFGQIYSVYDEAFAYAGSPRSLIPTDDADRGGEHVWAPDVIYNKAMGKYVMYYCTTSTWNASNLCYGISDSPEGPFEWQGALIYSGFDKDTIYSTDVLDHVDEDHAVTNYLKGPKYRYEDWPNAIDPNAFYDKDGRMWLVYGSWSGGIFLLEIDESTGKVIHPEADPENKVDAYYGKRLAGGGHMSMEAPYILWDETSGYYYLFVSYGGLNREGGYQIRVFRSTAPDGEYLDMNGKKPDKGLNHAYYGLKLSGNYMLPSLTKAYMATGHNSAFIDSDGKKYIVYHTRFDNGSEGHSPRVHQFIVNADGWPCMLPYQTQGETVSESGYPKEELAGRYYMIDQGTAINAEIAQPEIIYLNEDGTAVTEKSSGTWEVSDATYHMTIDLEDRTYTGVFCAMNDEAGTPVMTFSAVGFNESVWGVKYIE